MLRIHPNSTSDNGAIEDAQCARFHRFEHGLSDIFRRICIM